MKKSTKNQSKKVVKKQKISKENQIKKEKKIFWHLLKEAVKWTLIKFVLGIVVFALLILAFGLSQSDSIGYKILGLLILFTFSILVFSFAYLLISNRILELNNEKLEKLFMFNTYFNSRYYNIFIGVLVLLLGIIFFYLIIKLI